tara:strand:+ start:1416 stop:1649 length:234 start_codon:yes stop_codon:yes gene_type:complete
MKDYCNDLKKIFNNYEGESPSEDQEKFRELSKIINYLAIELDKCKQNNEELIKLNDIMKKEQEKMLFYSFQTSQLKG